MRDATNALQEFQFPLGVSSANSHPNVIAASVRRDELVPETWSLGSEQSLVSDNDVVNQ